MSLPKDYVRCPVLRFGFRDSDPITDPDLLAQFQRARNVTA